MGAVENIKERAKLLAEEKARKIIEEQTAKINKEKEEIEEVCNLINSGFYIRQEGYNSSKKLSVATVEAFEKDYNTLPDNSWNKGFQWGEWGNDYSSRDSFCINGIQYFHIGKLFKYIDKNIDDLTRRANSILSSIVDLNKQKENLLESFKSMKECLSNFEQIDLADKERERKAKE